MTVSQYNHVVPYTDLGGRGYFGVNAALVKYICLIENFCIAIQVSLKPLPEGPVDNKYSWVQAMAWHQMKNKPLPQPIVTAY